MSRKLGLFEGHGIELEYMIVDSETLNVRPISDEVMKAVAGEYVSDIEDGPITWSNELVLHVIELKTTGPSPTLGGLESRFHKSIERINGILSKMGACLMPTAMHPWMDPHSDTKLWPHDNNEIYDSYNRIFDCRGHGWSNLQSMHINLPFDGDDQFARLHTAIRFLLPILPALTASSPAHEGTVSKIKDTRLAYYQQNQKRIPSIAGAIIPEPVLSESEYREKILKKIFSEIAPHDPEELIRDDWLNSRGAITRFGRQTIEIRVLDTQECPAADLAFADLICGVIRMLVNETLCPMRTQIEFSTQELKSIFDEVICDAETARITNVHYLNAFGLEHDGSIETREIWNHLLHRCSEAKVLSPEHERTIRTLLASGSLATRIQKALGPNPTRTELIHVYGSLCDCLRENKLFIPAEHP